MQNEEVVLFIDLNVKKQMKRLTILSKRLKKLVYWSGILAQIL